MNQPIAGKWALVTGSSRGIGQQITLGLAQHGVNIVLHGREAQNTSATLKLLSVYDIEVKTVFGQIDTDAGVKSVTAQIANACDQVDILYANHDIRIM